MFACTSCCVARVNGFAGARARRWFYSAEATERTMARMVVMATMMAMLMAVLMAAMMTAAMMTAVTVR